MTGTTHLIYDTAGRLLAETNGAGATTREYVWIDDLPLAVVANVNTTPVVYYVHADHLNRPVKMTNSAKAVVWDTQYKPFGEVYSQSGSATLDARFPGQWYQLETGLAYNWNRHYDGTTGRYTPPDQLGIADGSSLYAYAAGNPTQMVDSRGLFVETIPLPPTTTFPIPPSIIPPFMGPGPDGGGNVNPGTRDGCAGLRRELAEHKENLKNFIYILDPYKFDNKNLLGKGRYKTVINGRIWSLQAQIENFERLLKECEDQYNACLPPSEPQGLVSSFTPISPAGPILGALP